MATIRKRTSQKGETTYHVQVRLKGHPPQTASFSRKTDAQNWAKNTESAILEGRWFKSSESRKRTVKELIDRYSIEYLPHKKNGKNQKLHFEWWKKKLGDYVLADVTPSKIADLKPLLAAEGKGPATQVRYLAALSHAFTIAMKEYGWIDDNPFRKVTKPKEPRGRVRFLDDNERKSLLQACAKESEDLHLFVLMALTTGARKDEIRRLTWNQIDLKRKTATIFDTKNGEIRVLPLATPVMKIIQAKNKVRRVDIPFLFPGRTNKAPATLRKPWESAIKKAGVEDFRIHDLRHTAASYLAMNGASLVEIAAILGHKTLDVVRRYAHLSESHIHGVVEDTAKKIFG